MSDESKSSWEALVARKRLADASAPAAESCRCGCPGVGGEFFCYFEASHLEDGKCDCACHRPPVTPPAPVFGFSDEVSPLLHAHRVARDAAHAAGRETTPLPPSNGTDLSGYSVSRLLAYAIEEHELPAVERELRVRIAEAEQACRDLAASKAREARVQQHYVRVVRERDASDECRLANEAELHKADRTIGELRAQARGWSAVWKACERAGMLSHFSPTASGQDRAVEFIEYLAADRARLKAALTPAPAPVEESRQ